MFLKRLYLANVTVMWTHGHETCRPADFFGYLVLVSCADVACGFRYDLNHPRYITSRSLLLQNRIHKSIILGPLTLWFFFLKVRGWRLHRGPHHHHLPDWSRRQLHWLLWTEQNSTRDCRVNHNPGRITISPLFGSLHVPRHSPTIPSFPWRTKKLTKLAPWKVQWLLQFFFE